MTIRRRRVRFLWIALVLALPAACAGFAPADRDACPADALAESSVVIDTATTARDDSRSVAELTKSAGIHIGRRALGSTESNLRVWIAYNHRATPATTRGVCLHAISVVVHTGYRDRVVHIARELTDDACLRREILAHEMRHVTLDDAILVDAGPGIRQVLDEAAPSLDGVWGADREAAEARLQQRVNAIQSRVLDDIEVARRRRHEIEIDTPAERRRATTMCGGRLLRYGLS